MKTYEVVVDGQTYIVKVREVAAGEVVEAKPLKVEQERVEKKEEAVVPPTPVSASEGAPITAPMAGTILSIKKQVGEQIKKGEVLFILEAMKMENEILAPTDGVVRTITVSVNSSVESDQLLMTM